MNFNDDYEHDSECGNPINMIPMIDIMLVLLVVFMIAMPVISSSVIQKVQSADNSSLPEQSESVVEIEVKNLKNIILEKQTISVEDLPSALGDCSAESTVTLIIDPDLTYHDLSMVLNILNQSGMHNIVFKGS